MALSAPTLLTSNHDTSQFKCQHEALSDWLRKHALGNNDRRGSRTYVVCEGTRVVGFYTLAAGSVEHEKAPGSVRRNMPNPIPAIVLGRLAVDVEYQGEGIGSGLLQDATFRALNAADEIGARVLLCHAFDDDARTFYLERGFLQSPIENLTVMLDLSKVLPLLEDHSTQVALPTDTTPAPLLPARAPGR